jgi:glycosyltransferase involved in cell wall biosynthesis
LYHSNLIGGLAARLCGLPVVWNIRHSVLEAHTQKRLTRLVGWSGARLSHRVPAAVVFVAQAARDHHVRHGYAAQPSRVIPNGFDITVFRPDAAARMEVRQELGLTPGCPLVGLFGRFHADKDHATFVRAAGQIHALRPDVHFLLTGTDVDAANADLVSLLERAGVLGHCHLLGPRPDMARLAASLDLQVSSSLSEAMPNVIGEAMACGVPCVVTDVGDSALLVGETGQVVPRGDSAALAARCLKLLALPDTIRRSLGALARERIMENFSFKQMVIRHSQLWNEAAGDAAGRPESPIAVCDSVKAA